LLRPRFVALVAGGNQPRDPLQLDDRVHHAGEAKPVALLQRLVRRNGGDHLLAAADLHQVEPRQVAHPRLRHGLADQPAARLDHHIDQVLPRRLPQFLQQVLPVRQQAAADEDDVKGP
jgi:hypothetical protein